MGSDEERKNVNAPPIHYCNAVNVGVSPFDVKISVFQRALTPNDEDELQAIIYMSLEHAKAMTRVINERIAVIEEQFSTEIFDPLPKIRELEQKALKEAKPRGKRPSKK